MKKFALFFLTVTISSLTWASSDDVEGPHHYLSGALGIFAPGANTMVGTRDNGNQATPSFTDSGPLAIGMDYDYMTKSDLSFGGFLRYYNASASLPNNTIKNSIFTIGPDVRGYLNVGNWTGLFSTGIGYISPTYSDGTGNVSIPGSFGLMFSVAALYRTSEHVQVGVQNLKLYGLTNNINGVPVDDYMFIARFAMAK